MRAVFTTVAASMALAAAVSAQTPSVRGSGGGSGGVGGGGFDLHAALRSAEPHATIVVPAGSYVGPFQIDAPLTLIGEGRPTLDGAGQGDVVRITAPGVTLRGFRVRGTGDSLDRENAGVVVTAPRATIEDNIFEDVLFGVYMKEAPGSVLRGNIIGAKPLGPARRGDGIRLWRCDDALVEGNRIQTGRDVVLWFCDRLVVRGNTVRDGRYGLHFMYSHDNTIENNILEGNSVGAFLMYSRNLTLRGNLFAHNRGPSGYGLGLKDMDGVFAEDNRFVGNRVGVNLDNSPSSIDEVGRFTRNVIAGNDIGLAWLPSVERNTFTDNAFVDNMEQLAVLGTGSSGGNHFDEGGVGNYWGDYAGFDLDADGVGDLPHVVKSFFEDLLDRDPRMRLFLLSPVQQAVNTATRAVPLVAPRVKAVDASPRLRPVSVTAPLPERPSARSAAALSVGLFGAAAAMIACAGFMTTRLTNGAASAERTSRSNRTDAAPPALRVEHLTKRYGKSRVVDDVSFLVNHGEAVAMWGSNGAGKTTILRCILEHIPCQGSVSVFGVPAASRGRSARRMIGYVPQEAALYSDLTVLQTMRLFAKLRRAPRQRIGSALEEVELDAHRRKRVGALSGGMRRRLTLAISLLSDPPLLLLDEPTANLDVAGRDAFLALLKRLIERGKTVVFTTHRAEDVATLADRVLVLDQGRLVGERKPAEICGKPELDRLRVDVAREHLEKALAALLAHGVEATSSEGAIHVAMASSGRAEPLRLLYEAGVRIDDLMFSTNDRAGDARRQGGQP